jgi:hypothetical protein
MLSSLASGIRRVLAMDIVLVVVHCVWNNGEDCTSIYFCMSDIRGRQFADYGFYTLFLALLPLWMCIYLFTVWCLELCVSLSISFLWFRVRFSLACGWWFTTIFISWTDLSTFLWGCLSMGLRAPTGKSISLSWIQLSTVCHNQC